MEKIYVVYEDYKKVYYEVQKQYNQTLEEREKLFAKTQPQSLKFDKLIIDNNNYNNAFESYLIAKERMQIDKRISELKIILEDRKNLLETKEKELRKSKQWIDKLYVYKYIENLSVKEILQLMPYEEAQIYRMLKQIKKVIGR